MIIGGGTIKKVNSLGGARYALGSLVLNNTGTFAWSGARINKRLSVRNESGDPSKSISVIGVRAKSKHSPKQNSKQLLRSLSLAGLLFILDMLHTLLE
jgi:hypothetical protein